MFPVGLVTPCYTVETPWAVYLIWPELWGFPAPTGGNQLPPRPCWALGLSPPSLRDDPLLCTSWVLACMPRLTLCWRCRSSPLPVSDVFLWAAFPSLVHFPCIFGCLTFSHLLPRATASSLRVILGYLRWMSTDLSTCFKWCPELTVLFNWWSAWHLEIQTC